MLSVGLELPFGRSATARDPRGRIHRVLGPKVLFMNDWGHVALQIDLPLVMLGSDEAALFFVITLNTKPLGNGRQVGAVNQLPGPVVALNHGQFSQTW